MVVALGMLVVLVGAAAADETNARAGIKVDGDSVVLKDLLIDIKAYDAQTRNLIVGVTWNGRWDVPRVWKEVKNHADRAIDDFLVDIVVMYKGSVLFSKEAEIHVKPGRGIVVEFDDQRVELSGENSEYDGWPELRVVQTIDGEVVEATLKPSVKIKTQKTKRRERIIEFLYYVMGDVTVHDRRGTYRAYFDAQVVKVVPLPLSLLTMLGPTLAAARRPFRRSTAGSSPV